MENTLFILYSETVELIGEGEYNLDALKYIAATDSYLGLGQNIIGCQNKESYENCTTRHYIDNFLGKCGCMPFNIRLENRVYNSFI